MLNIQNSMAFVQAHFSLPHFSCRLTSLANFHRQDTCMNNTLSEPARGLPMSWLITAISHTDLLGQDVVPANIHTLPMDGHWKFRGGGGSQRPKLLKESMKPNWNFPRVGGVQSEKPSVGEVWIFSETTQCMFWLVLILTD